MFLVLEVRSVRFRASLNISVYKIRLDHLGQKGGAPGPGLGFFLHFFHRGGRCFGIAGFKYNKNLKVVNKYSDLECCSSSESLLFLFLEGIVS